MMLPESLSTVSIGELSREPRRVIERVMRGERLIVCRHGHPLATLQPLDGCVTQPFSGRVNKLNGSPVADLETQLDGLLPIEKKLLMDGVSRGRFVTAGVGDVEGPSPGEILRQWEVRGLARRIRGRGTFATGRALLLREALLKRADRPLDVIGLLPLYARDNPF